MNSFDARDYFQKMYRIVGAAMTLYNELGHGFSEAVYQECLSILCREEGIPWEREKKLTEQLEEAKEKKKESERN